VLLAVGSQVEKSLLIAGLLGTTDEKIGLMETGYQIAGWIRQTRGQFLLSVSGRHCSALTIVDERAPGDASILLK
jgi:hypothetical protein